MAEELALKVKLDTSDLEKSMGKISAGAGASSGGGVSTGQALGAGAMAGAVAAGMTAVIGTLKKGFDMMREASPMLEGTIKIFQQSLMLILKPIGDIMAMFLRPFALAFLKYAVNFYKKWHELKDSFNDGFQKMLEGLKTAFSKGLESLKQLRMLTH